MARRNLNLMYGCVLSCGRFHCHRIPREKGTGAVWGQPVLSLAGALSLTPYSSLCSEGVCCSSGYVHLSLCIQDAFFLVHFLLIMHENSLKDAHYLHKQFRHHGPLLLKDGNTFVDRPLSCCYFLYPVDSELIVRLGGHKQLIFTFHLFCTFSSKSCTLRSVP